MTEIIDEANELCPKNKVPVLEIIDKGHKVSFVRRPSHQTYVTPTSANKAREELVMERYNTLSEKDKANIDQQALRLHDHFTSHNFKPEPSLLYRLELVFLVGTFLNSDN